jgi:hypothetical protein
LNFLLLEAALFQLLNFPLLEASLLQLLPDLLLLPKLLLSPLDSARSSNPCLLLHLADLLGDLPGLLLGLLAVVALPLQGLFDLLLNFTLLESFLFQLLNLTLFQAGLAQLLPDLLFLLLANLFPAKLLWLPELLIPWVPLLEALLIARSKLLGSAFLLNLSDPLRQFLRILAGLLSIVALSAHGFFHFFPDFFRLEALALQFLDVPLAHAVLLQLLADLCLAPLVQPKLLLFLLSPELLLAAAVLVLLAFSAELARGLSPARGSEHDCAHQGADCNFLRLRQKGGGRRRPSAFVCLLAWCSFHRLLLC